MGVSHALDGGNGQSLRRRRRVAALYNKPDIELGQPGNVPAAALARRTRDGVPLGAMLCLLATGTLLGISTNLAKVASAAALPPLAYLAWSITGAALVLLVIALLRGTLPRLTAHTLEYYALSAFTTVAASNLIVFSAIPHVGASFIAPVIALPPILTYVGALALGMEPFSQRRATGVVLALVGALWIALMKLTLPDAPTFWILLTLASPLLFAVGNLYRTLRWPAGLSADALAPGMLVAAAAMLLATGLIPYPAFSIALPSDSALPLVLVLLQTIVFAAQFLLLLELQRRGGPVYLSLFGSVGALVGIPIAVLLLGERTPDGLVIGAGLIGAGVVLLSTPKRQRGVKAPRREARRGRLMRTDTDAVSTTNGEAINPAPIARKRAPSGSRRRRRRRMSRRVGRRGRTVSAFL